MELSSISELITEISSGRMVILVDDEDRENEGDLVLAADYVTPEMINFMATQARGLVCLSLTAEQIERLQIPLMVRDEANRSPNRTAFTLSIEAARGVSTGISAADRAHTIRVAANPGARPQDIIVPGHIFPIRAQEGGVLKRAGHTEASVDLVRLAGLNPAAVICEIMNPDGSMARLPQLLEFAAQHGIKVGSIEELIRYRVQNETFVEEISRAAVDTEFASGFVAHLFRNQLDGREHLAFVKGQVAGAEPVLVRMQNESVMGDVFGIEQNGSRADLHKAFSRIEEEGRGVVVYLRNEDMAGRLEQRLQEIGRVTGRGSAAVNPGVFASDQRDYGVGAQILRALGVRHIRLLSKSATRRVGLKGYGLEIVETVPLRVAPREIEV